MGQLLRFFVESGKVFGLNPFLKAEDEQVSASAFHRDVRMAF
jgi:hypothetical protein